MKNKILSLISALVLLVSIKETQAQNITTFTVLPATNVVLNAPYHLLSIQALASVSQTLNFYDSASTNIFWTNAAYVTRLSYATNITNVTLAANNPTGINQTNVYSGIWTYNITNNPATNTLLPIVTLLLQANVPVNIAVDDRLLRGLVATSTNTATVVVTYNANVGQ